MFLSRKNPLAFWRNSVLSPVRGVLGRSRILDRDVDKVTSQEGAYVLLLTLAGATTIIDEEGFLEAYVSERKRRGE